MKPARHGTFRTGHHDESGCWLWAGARDAYGYGAATGHTKAHRLVYEALVGPIPRGLTIDHLCRVRACVNPTHLEPVTRGENVLRGESRGAVALRENHCYQGHSFTPENTIVRRDGSRLCRSCKRKRERER